MPSLCRFVRSDCGGWKVRHLPKDWLLFTTFGEKKDVDAMAYSMLFISFGWLLTSPAVIELLLA